MDLQGYAKVESFDMGLWNGLYSGSIKLVFSANTKILNFEIFAGGNPDPLAMSNVVLYPMVALGTPPHAVMTQEIQFQGVPAVADGFKAKITLEQNKKVVVVEAIRTV